MKQFMVTASSRRSAPASPLELAAMNAARYG
jgi:hypothetical protein